jgi:hypothetical protein
MQKLIVFMALLAICLARPVAEGEDGGVDTESRFGFGGPGGYGGYGGGYE